jgi:hypothetical protein
LICSAVPPLVALLMAQAASFLMSNSAVCSKRHRQQHSVRRAASNSQAQRQCCTVCAEPRTGRQQRYTKECIIGVVKGSQLQRSIPFTTAIPAFLSAALHALNTLHAPDTQDPASALHSPPAGAPVGTPAGCR